MYVKCRKIQGKHHMYCPIRKKAVVLGKDCDDGDVAYLSPSQAKAVNGDSSWEVLDAADENKVLAEEVGEPAGLLILVPKGGGWYDVRNTATGKILNTTSLRLEDASALVSGEADGDAGDGDDGE